MEAIEPKKSITYLIRAIMLSTLTISALGYVDMITGEISLDILYLLCVCLVAWHTNTLLGIVSVIEVLLAKTTADYFCHVMIGNRIYGWNAISYFIVFVVICVLVRTLKKVLSS